MRYSKKAQELIEMFETTKKMKKLTDEDLKKAFEVRLKTRKK